jgi:heat shock protein HtpX
MPSNFAKTGILLIALTGIFMAMGALVGGQDGMVVAFVIALGINAFSYWNSGSVALKMFRAQELSPNDAPWLFDLTGKLAARARLPMPKLYLLDSPQPNAFATGRNPANSAVAVSTGLLDTLSHEELAGVVAHELAHISNRDTLTMTVAATIAGAISMFANLLQFGFLFGRNRSNNNPLGWIGALAAILLAPFAAMLVQMAISRSREYEADRIGAITCGNPLWLASALGRIHAVAAEVPNEDAEAVPAAAHMFIINPLTGRGFDNWFTTHPATENRIAELQRLADEWPSIGAPPPLDFGGGGPSSSHLDNPSQGEGLWDGSSGTPPARGPWS